MSRVRCRVWSAGAVVALVAACAPEAPGPEAPEPERQIASGAIQNDGPWLMHPVATAFRGANGLSAGDVNHDGFVDYITNYEFDQRAPLLSHRAFGVLQRSVAPTRPQPHCNERPCATDRAQGK